MDEAEGFGLGVDFVACHGDLQSFLGVVKAAVHDTDGANGDEAENADGEHDFDERIAPMKKLMELCHMNLL